jgi:plasmid stabilization system protein ParE
VEKGRNLKGKKEQYSATILASIDDPVEQLRILKHAHIISYIREFSYSCHVIHREAEGNITQFCLSLRSSHANASGPKRKGNNDHYWSW